MAHTVPEILEMADKAKSREEKLQILRKHTNEAVKIILMLNFHPTVRMDLPEGEPPYKKDKDLPVGVADTNLLQSVNKFYIWIKKDGNLPRLKKESLFVNLLEGLHWSEAEILCLAKDQKLNKKYKTIKEDLVRDLYPGVIPEKKLTSNPQPSAPV